VSAQYSLASTIFPPFEPKEGNGEQAEAFSVATNFRPGKPSEASQRSRLKDSRSFRTSPSRSVFFKTFVFSIMIPPGQAAYILCDKRAGTPSLQNEEGRRGYGFGGFGGLAGPIPLPPRLGYLACLSVRNSSSSVLVRRGLSYCSIGPVRITDTKWSTPSNFTKSAPGRMVL